MVQLQHFLLLPLLATVCEALSFGEGGKVEAIAEMGRFPTGEELYENYVKVSKPLKMSGAAKLLPAFHLWTDEYFLSRPLTNENKVLVETRKKEERTQETLFMPFRDFLSHYNNSGIYMVQPIVDMPYISRDFVLVLPLQCDPIVYEGLSDALMWFSSGGTSSVIHTDDMENILCVMSGNKSLVFVDPAQPHAKEIIDKSNGAFSSLDVDNVDLKLMPFLTDLTYNHVELTAGDCLYIPYRWIHQVRSVGRNIGVNLWWDESVTSQFSAGACNEVMDELLTLDKLQYNGAGGYYQLSSFREDLNNLRHHCSKSGPTSFDEFLKFTLKGFQIDESALEEGSDIRVILRQLFKVLDVDSNSKLDTSDFDGLGTEAVKKAHDLFSSFLNVANQLAAALDERDDTALPDDDIREEEPGDDKREHQTVKDDEQTVDDSKDDEQTGHEQTGDEQKVDDEQSDDDSADEDRSKRPDDDDTKSDVTKEEL